MFQNPPSSPLVFHKLGEPMLCTRTEIMQQQHSPGSDAGGDANNFKSADYSNQKVLLRTWVSLHDNYQCQGK